MWWILVLPCTLLAAAVLLLGLWPARPVHPEARAQTLIVYGFSVLENVFKEGLAPAFQRQWEAQTGKPVHFISVFASLGQVTNELLAHIPADVAFLSPEFGARQLREAGLITAEPGAGGREPAVFARTPVIIVVRPGNPLGIQDFPDLARPGVKVIHSNPRTSGGGYWTILAEHGAGWRRSGRWQDGHELLLAIWKNTTAMGGSARETRLLFENGLGDALVTYEQDALWALKQGILKGEIVHPRRTVLAEVCLVVMEQNIEDGERQVVEALRAFLWSEAARGALVEHGFRTSGAGDGKDGGGVAEIEDPFRIEDLGGWKRVRSDIIEDSWRRVQQELEK